LELASVQPSTPDAIDMTRVLFVDDEPLLLRGLQAMARRDRRLEPTFVASGKEALLAWEAAPFDVVVTDMRMPAMSGVELLEALAERGAHAKRILLTGYADESMLERAQRICTHVLTKPCPWAELVAAIDPQASTTEAGSDRSTSNS
jgi:two-component system response regulator YesN